MSDDLTITDSEFKLFRDLIYRTVGISLSDAKRQLVQSRLRKRLIHHGLTTFRAYYDRLIAEGENSPEMGTFINCITTNKTDFFREAHHFEFVKNTIAPALIEQERQGLRPPCVQVWHAGCSTGEEPYTLGMTLAEIFPPGGRWQVRQLASDIDTDVLAKAEAGIYDEERTQPIPAPLLKKYFLRGKGTQEGRYRVVSALRDRITFRQINLLASNWNIRPNARFDMIFCRNVIIYFDKPTQKRLIERYRQYLRPGGTLFIGHSESLLGISDAFDNLGHTIYHLPATETRKDKAA